MGESYYIDKQLEFLNLTKLELAKKNLFFLTLATEEAWDTLLTSDITFEHVKIKVNVTKKKDASNLSELCISLTLVVNNLPQKESYSLIMKSIKKCFDEDNIIGVWFGSTSWQAENKHSR